MSRLIPAAAAAAAILLATAGGAAAEDQEAGVSLSPAEAVGAWTLETSGRSICVLKLGAQKAGPGIFKLEAPDSCGAALPSGLAGWSPSPHGMNMVDAGGRALLGFGRWSNSLLVSHPSSGEDVQLRRGT